MVECDLLTMSPKNRSQVEALYLLAKEGQSKSVLHDYHARRQAMSRYYLGAMIVSDVVVDVMRRELRRISPGVKIGVEELKCVLEDEVLKRDVVEGDKAVEARRKLQKFQSRALKVKARAATANGPDVPPEEEDVPDTDRSGTTA